MQRLSHMSGTNLSSCPFQVLTSWPLSGNSWKMMSFWKQGNDTECWSELYLTHTGKRKKTLWFLVLELHFFLVSKNLYAEKEEDCLLDVGSILPNSQKHKTTESFRLQKTLKIMHSNHKPNTAKSTTKPCP